MPTYNGRLERRFDDVYPAPYLTVRIHWRGQHRDLPGLIDSGADQSVIPGFVVAALAIEKASEVPIAGVSGIAELQDTYVVDMELPGYFVGALEVSTTGWPFVLVGRDVLSDLVTELDGASLTFAFTAPGPSSGTSS
jgi:hypothetical protein